MTTVIVPWRPGCSHRVRAWTALKPRYPWPVVEVFCDPWSKARAISEALPTAPNDVLVVADADVWCDAIESAVRAVTCGVASWAMPHRKVHRLSEQGTEDFLAGRSPAAFAQRPYEGVWGGGIVVAHRDTLLEVPPDPRFVGWGQEDESHATALHTLAGPGWRGDADLWHLFHPPQERWTRRRGSKESWALYLRYRRARGDQQAMTALIEEAKLALEFDFPAVHDRQAIAVN